MSKKSLRGLSLVLFFAIAASVTPAQAEQNIIDTAKSAGNFQTLFSALEAADLVETLQGEGPFTVFAPTDEAFAKLPPGTLERLLANKEKLKKILLFHVASGKVSAADVMKMRGIGTLMGKRAVIRVSEDGVTIGAARVTKTDIPCTNGTIHVIDAVLMPE